MNLVNWFENYPMTRDQHDLYIMLIGFIFIFLFFMRPKKSDYKNIFLAWIIYLILLASTVVCIWFLFYFGIFPYTFGFGILDQIFWMLIFLIFGVIIQRLLVAITKRLKIYKDEN
jgi:hypothetical protein